MSWNSSKHKKAGGSWTCLVKRRASRERYYKSEKGRASHAKREVWYRATEKGKTTRAETHRRHNATDKRRASIARYQATCIKVRIGGARFTYRIPPERKDELLAKLAEHRAGQRAEYREEFA